MLRHKFGAAALFAAAALALGPTASQAQFGFSIGRGWGGRTNWGISVGTPGYYGYGGYYGNYGNWGYPGSYGYRGWGYGNSPWYGGSYYSSYPRSYLGYGWNSYPSAYSSYNYSYPTYSYSPPSYYSISPSYTYSTENYPSGDTGYYGGYGGTMYNTGDTSYSYGAMTTTPNAAHLNVRLPKPNAEVWIEGTKTQQQGTWREFVSPSLEPNKNYTYEVKARWTDENGNPVEKTRTVPVTANGVATVDFTSTRPDTDRGRTTDFDKGDSGNKSDRQ